MRALRLVFAALGLAGVAYGALLAIQVLTHSLPDGISAASWLVGGPIVHDALLAPVVGVLGVLSARRLGPAWRVPVLIGAPLSGLLVLLSVPALWRTYGGADNPGLDHRGYGTGVLIWLATVWLAVVAAGVARTVLARRRESGVSGQSTPLAAAPATGSADNDEGPHTDR